ncbi:MAG: nucleotidyltransferase domain-containing protein [Nanoarchaeota archaeon]|nr:nucleotidyltransferase domain-containing protein [Nanoarchaeota archaeon]
MVILNEQKKKLIKEIAEKHNLDLIVLFGSQAKNRASKESDIDIGIYSKSGLDFDKKIKILKDFSDIFESNNIDLGIISSNSPLLMYSILKDGEVLYEKENSLVYKLRFYAWKLLAESKSFRDHSFSLLKNKIALL